MHFTTVVYWKSWGQTKWIVGKTENCPTPAITHFNEFSSLSDSTEEIRASAFGEQEKHERIEFYCSVWVFLTKYRAILKLNFFDFLPMDIKFLCQNNQATSPAYSNSII